METGEKERTLSASSSRSSENLPTNDDEYHEDDLPDLVLDTHYSGLSLNSGARRLSSSSSLENNNDDDSSSSSVIDLLLSLTRGRRSVSTSDLFADESVVGEVMVDAEDDELDAEEVRAERCAEGRGFKVKLYKTFIAYMSL